ncbi:MAG: transcriptional regulator NrdR [Polyangiaceae bacterium]
MRCAFCGHHEDRVIDSRASANGDVIRRRRECEGCGKRFTTYERIEYVLPTVVKKDGRREPFDRKKVLASLTIACTKRPIGAEQLEGIADAVERELDGAQEREVASTTIGERVMTLLKGVDQVAYVRFASVYRSFRDIGEFAAELGRMQTPEPPTAAPPGDEVVHG